jgi:hypothetical protein
MMHSTQSKQSGTFRKSLLLPAEHGSWVWLFVPFGVGAVVAGRLGEPPAGVPLLLTLLGGVALFLLRQPLTLWLRGVQGRGRPRDLPLLQRLVVSLAIIALACLCGLLLGYGRYALLILLVPIAVIFVGYVLLAHRRRKEVRTLRVELAGAVALAGMAPAAYIAATGELNPTAWLLWGVVAAQNGLGALYVRQRLGDTHNRSTTRWPTLAAHGLLFLLVLMATMVDLMPWLVLLPFSAFLLRALWTSRAPRPVPDVRQFGFIELGVEIVGGLLIAFGSWH